MEAENEWDDDASDCDFALQAEFMEEEVENDKFDVGTVRRMAFMSVFCEWFS